MNAPPFFSRHLGEWMDRWIPNAAIQNLDAARRGRLVTRFGLLGSLFGLVYGTFYMLIGHHWGASIIVVCSSAFFSAPFLMQRTQSIDIAGNFLCLILTLGFSALCCCEGGLTGHAIAWLVSVPLCALLLVSRTWALRWVIIAFVAATIIAALDIAGVQLPITYNHKWNSIVSAAGLSRPDHLHVRSWFDF